MEFTYYNQGVSIQSFKGPSGYSYTSQKGKPFVVDIKEDVEFFKSKKQFQKPKNVVVAPKKKK